MNNTCSYCHAAIGEDDHRCHRCGSRLHLSPSQAIAAAYGISNTATARAIRPATSLSDPVAVEEAAQCPENAPESNPRRVAYQRPLFSSKEVPHVVPFESIAPKVERKRNRTEPSKPRAKRPIPGQQTLEFTAPAEPMETEVEAFIYCDAPVAIPAHRVMATAVDWSLIAIALGVFLGIFQLLGGEVILTKQTMPLFLGIAAVFGLFYKILWCLAGSDSPGMRWAHLRLVNFDGQSPEREQRMFRIASACLSFMAACLGIMWALVDEESLTWHDHISKTFPTPY